RAADDPDGDGMSNMNEFLAGTDPLNSASVFKITQVAAGTDGIQVSCSTTSNRAYQLQRRADLAVSSPWANIGTPTTGTGGIMVLIDDLPTNTAAYYRVEAH